MKIITRNDSFQWVYVGIIISCVSIIEGKDGCKELLYLDCVKNKTFTGHVVKTTRILAPGLETCQHQCFLEDKCISYNLGPIEQQIIRSCELSDADHVTDSSDVEPQKGAEYCPIKNLCLSSPCPSGKLCTPDFYWDTFKCSDGRWSQWGEWSGCYCPRNRTRRCENPQSAVAFCDGSQSEEEKECKATPAALGGCSAPMGMKDGRIKDAQITASSYWKMQSDYRPSLARLHQYPSSRTSYDDGWCAGVDEIGQYLQVDLIAANIITKIATQGKKYTSNIRSRWVTEYTLAYSNDNTAWTDYRGLHQNCTTHFAGNTDRNTVVTHELPIPITARYIRVVVQKWRVYPCMRMELYGCTYRVNDR